MRGWECFALAVRHRQRMAIRQHSSLELMPTPAGRAFHTSNSLLGHVMAQCSGGLAKHIEQHHSLDEGNQ
jgi:hypothetical protein